MVHQFTARLKGIEDPQTPAFIEVPRIVMRSLRWGKRVRVVATINGHTYQTTIRNVGFGPSLSVNKHVRTLAGIERNDYVAVAIREICI